MHHYSQGKSTKQAHKGIPEGVFEEEQGRHGFFGLVSHLLRRKPTTRWTDIEGPLRPHLFDLIELAKTDTLWRRLLFNSDVSVFYAHYPKTESEFEVAKQMSSASSFAFSHGTAVAQRNADGDTLYFCHSGRGQILTDFGLLSFHKGSYVSIPKCVTHTFLIEEAAEFLVIESKSGPYGEPDRGMLGKNAFYDMNALGKPDLDARDEALQKWGAAVTRVEVKRAGQKTTFKYDDCVYDTLGWKGDYFPFTLHIDDLMPLNSHRAHLPPSAHTTFVARGFVVCTFLPRPLESDEDALKVPFYHQNIDYDEVLFYHDGDFFSRDNLHAGMMTLHPAGFSHGPHPKAISGVSKKTHTDEKAVMIDTWQGLEIEPALAKVELPDYWKSWR